MISYEEFHPYGTSAYRLLNSAAKAPPKRYRYTGMERDEESGLNYHTGRYLVPWLARWASSDPSNLIDGPNLYRYALNPLRHTDRDGRAETVNPDNPDTFETVSKKAVQAWNTGTDARDRRNRFAAEISKKYTHSGMSGEHAWHLWATTTIPIDDILTATDVENDDAARLLAQFSPSRWVWTFDALFTPGVPIDKEALLKASGATAKTVEVFLQRPTSIRLPPSSLPPGYMPALATATANEAVLLNREAAVLLNPGAPVVAAVSGGNSKVENQTAELPKKGTPAGDTARYDRYKAAKSADGEIAKSFNEWFSSSRGGRSGGANHQQIQEALYKSEATMKKEVRFRDRFADAANMTEVHQIGGRNVRGDPISRERSALRTLLDALDKEAIENQMSAPRSTYFWDKSNPQAPPMQCVWD